MNEPTPPGIEEGAASTPLDVNAMDYQARVDYILNIRRRVQEDRTKVSDDEIRDAVRMIRIDRGASPKSKNKKEAVPKVTLADF